MFSSASGTSKPVTEEEKLQFLHAKTELILVNEAGACARSFLTLIPHLFPTLNTIFPEVTLV